jgi:hypothetical protein
MKCITKTNWSCVRCLGVTNAPVVTEQALRPELQDTVACLSDLQVVRLDMLFVIVAPEATVSSIRGFTILSPRLQCPLFEASLSSIRGFSILYPRFYYPLSEATVSSIRGFTILSPTLQCPLLEASLASIRGFTILYPRFHYPLSETTMSSL